MKNHKFIKLLLGLLIIPSLFVFFSTNTSAANAAFENRTGAACQGFLGLTSWDCNVNISDEQSLKSGIWTIASNIATDIIIIAAYLVLGYVIYGGYLYIFSSGEASKVASGKKTLAHAFIGLAIVMSSYVIMSAIRFALLGGSGRLVNCATQPGACISPSDLVSNAIGWVIAVSGIVSLIFVVYGGIGYATSAGDPNKLQKAKQTIMYALIGLAIVALAQIITAFVTNMIRTSSSSILYPIHNNQQIPLKEIYEIKHTN